MGDNSNEWLSLVVGFVCGLGIGAIALVALNHSWINACVDRGVIVREVDSKGNVSWRWLAEESEAENEI